MKTRLSPQQKKRNNYAKDRRNAYGERGANSRFAIARNKRLSQRSRRHAENGALRTLDAETASDDGLTLAELRTKSQPASRKRFRKSPDIALRAMIAIKLARRERYRETARRKSLP